MKRALLCSILILSLLGSFRCSSKGVKMADMILVNGTVWTVDDAAPRAEAVAVAADRILAVGTERDIKRMAGPSTQVIDARGGFVLPGFVDSHTHFLAGGHALSSIQLREAKTKEDFVRRIADKARSLGKGEWILNGDWDQQQFDPPELPAKEWVDAVTPENPVCVNRHDGHMILANSLALRLAGITKNTSAPEGGEILKDPRTGEPTGILKDAAMDLVYRHVPEPSWDEKLRAAREALRHATERGVTSIHDMADPPTFEVYEELLRQGKLSARLCVYIPITEVELFTRLRMKTPFGGELLKLGGLKGFVDGSLGSGTAYFFEPYADQPGNSGLLVGPMYPEGVMEERILAADRGGIQVAIHAIGDRANALLLDMFEKVQAANGRRDRRWRIEHAQHLRPADIARFGALAVVASVQPYHAIDDGRWAGRKIGPERCRTTYAFRSLLDAGAVLACGSDWTVAPLDPLSGIYAAATRRTTDGLNPQGWVPEQRISVPEAIRGYTLSGAFAEFGENDKGSIRPGKLADLVVLDRNILDLPAKEIPTARVVATILGGRVVYRR